MTTLEGAKQTLPMGPVASQEAIKQLGTNGGGFFNANSAHPFENPTPWSNFLQMVAIFLIPAGLVYMFGRMVNNRRHAWAVWATMFVLFFGGVTTAYWAEARGNPIHAARGIDVADDGDEPRRQHGRQGGPLRHRQLRPLRDRHDGRVLWRRQLACTTRSRRSAASCPLVNMQLGELVFGGVGAGLYGMIVEIVLAVFIAGLMVGRTPEYLGKRIESREIRMVMLFVLVYAFVVLDIRPPCRS